MNKMTKIIVLSATALSIVGASGAAFANKKHDGKGKRGMVAFEQLDTNADGFVTKDELQAKAAERFATADADKDGFLSADELANSKPKMGKRGGEDKAPSERQKARMLRFMDENGDGKVALEEMPTDRMDKMFERLDTDKDGKISKAEMEAKKGKHHKKK